jgi:CRP-like cAMP-binding protein
MYFYLEEQNLKKGQYLYREGDPVISGVYFLVKGCIQRLKEDPYTQVPKKLVIGPSKGLHAMVSNDFL